MRSIAIVPVFREVGRIVRVLEKFKPGSVDEICLTLDSPNESIRAVLEESRKRTDVPVTIIENPDRKGGAHAIREGYDYALSHGFDLIIVMAVHGKDDPREKSRLVDTVSNGDWDYV